MKGLCCFWCIPWIVLKFCSFIVGPALKKSSCSWKVNGKKQGEWNCVVFFVWWLKNKLRLTCLCTCCTWSLCMCPRCAWKLCVCVCEVLDGAGGNWSGNSDPKQCSRASPASERASGETSTGLCSLWKHHRNEPYKLRFHFQLITLLCHEFRTICETSKSRNKASSPPPRASSFSNTPCFCLHVLVCLSS